MLHGTQLKEALEQYKGKVAIELGLSKASIKGRRNFLIRLEKYLSDKPFDLENARAFIDSLRTSVSGAPTKVSSMQSYIARLRAFCQFLVDEEYIEKNFCEKIRKPRAEPRQLELISEEKAYEVILQGTTPGKGDRSPSIYKKQETRAALVFILSTGRRVSEALKLTGKDLFLEDAPPWYQVIQKGRVVYQPFECPPNMIEELKKRQKRQRVFDTSETACNIALRRGLRVLNIANRITVHRLRDIFSVTRLRKNVPIQKVSRLLGHKDIRVTDRYYSDYVMEDLSDGLRTSDLIRHGLTMPEIMEDMEKSIREKAKDDRFQSILVRKETDKFIVELPFSELGIKEIKKLTKRLT